jgi:beta-glucosidase
MTEAPQYRFGFGLSYTRFAYSNLRFRASGNECRESGVALMPTAMVEVSVDVRNVGERDGDEVVQLYVSDVEASVPVPRHHLEGFARVCLKAGETKTIDFVLHPDQFVCYTDEGRPFLEPGVFRISVGGGQPDDPASGAVSTVLTIG